MTHYIVPASAVFFCVAVLALVLAGWALTRIGEEPWK